MKIWSDSFKDGDRIPDRYTFGKPNAETHFELSENRNPHIAWSDLPAGTKSLVLICHDSDVPSLPDNVNVEGAIVPATLPRVDFYHWVLVDLAPEGDAIAEGEFSSGISPRGKEGPAGPRGTRQGVNNFTQWFAGNADMAGDYFGYDGPAPPWNDELTHHYHFTLYATDLNRFPAEGILDGPTVRAAIAGHVLREARITGTYAINPNPKK